MSSGDKEAQHRYIAFSSAILAGASRPNEDGEVMNSEDICDLADEVACMMEENFQARFATKRVSSRKKPKVEVIDDEDEDDEDD